MEKNDHGIYYERRGRVRERYGDPEDGFFDNLVDPDFGVLKADAQAVKDLTTALIEEGPNRELGRKWTAKHIKVLADIETRALEVAAYAAALRMFHGGR